MVSSSIASSTILLHNQAILNAKQMASMSLVCLHNAEVEGLEKPSHLNTMRTSAMLMEPLEWLEEPKRILLIHNGTLRKPKRMVWTLKTEMMEDTQPSALFAMV